MGILSRLGLSKPVNPPATVDPIGFVDWEAKFKKAAADLAESAFRIEALEADLRSANTDAEEWKAAALAYQPDAEAMRAKRKRDRDLKAEKAKAAAAPKAASKKAVGK